MRAGVRALVSDQYGPGSNPSVDIIIMWVEFSLALRGFSPGTPVSPSPHKLTFLKFQFDQEWLTKNHFLCGCATSKSLPLLSLLLHVDYYAEKQVRMIINQG